jgi:hypothetical protein
MKSAINASPDLEWLAFKINTFFSIEEYGATFGESRTTIWRAISDGDLESFSRGKKKFIVGHSAAKRNNCTHLLRDITK